MLKKMNFTLALAVAFACTQAIGNVDAQEKSDEKTETKQDNEKKLLGSWEIDLEETLAHLKEIDREDEADENFLAIAESIVLEFKEGGVLGMQMQPPGAPEPMTREQKYEVTKTDEDSVTLKIVEASDGEGGVATAAFLENGKILFTPDDTFPVILKRVEKSDEAMSDKDDAKPVIEGAADLVGAWRINMEKTKAHLKSEGMSDDDLDEMAGEMEKMQIEYMKDGSFRVEIGGREMEGTWEVKSFDKETDTTECVMNLSMGETSIPRKFAVKKLEDDAFLITPEGDPATVFERIKEDSEPAKDGKKDDN